MVRRNFFGEIIPANSQEMIEAMVSKGRIDGEGLYAVLSANTDQGEPWEGWGAEVMTSKEGDSIFVTVGYADKETLVRDLKAAGIRTTVEVD